MCAIGINSVASIHRCIERTRVGVVGCVASASAYGTSASTCTIAAALVVLIVRRVVGRISDRSVDGIEDRVVDGSVRRNGGRSIVVKAVGGGAVTRASISVRLKPLALFPLLFLSPGARNVA